MRPFWILAHDLVDEDVLGGDDVALGADHLGDVGDAARAVAQTLGLDDDVDRIGDHLADGLRGQREAAHGDHRFQTGKRLARAVGVERAHRAVVAGVHGLEQIERLRSAHLADDDALGPHAQAVLDQVAHGDLALALDIGRAGLETDHVGLLQLKLGGVLGGDDALVRLDVARQAVEQRRLAGAGAAGDQHVAARAGDDLEDGGAIGGDRAVLDELIEGELVLLELADGQGRPVDGERRSDDVDAAAVGEARVADRRGFVDAPADLADDALADVHQLRVVAETDRGLLHLAVDFDVGPEGAVDHDVGDVVAGEQRLERAEAENVVADVLEQVFLLGDGHDDVLERDDVVDDVADFLARRLGIEAGELRQVDGVDEGGEDGRLDVVEILRAAHAPLTARGARALIGAAGRRHLAVRRRPHRRRRHDARDRRNRRSRRRRRCRRQGCALGLDRYPRGFAVTLDRLVDWCGRRFFTGSASATLTEHEVSSLRRSFRGTGPATAPERCA